MLPHVDDDVASCNQSVSVWRKKIRAMLTRHTVIAIHSALTTLTCFMVQNQGMPQPKVKIQAMSRANQNIDVTVAAEDLKAGQTVLQVPEHLIITLAGVFEDEVMLMQIGFACSLVNVCFFVVVLCLLCFACFVYCAVLAVPAVLCSLSHHPDPKCQTYTSNIIT